MRQGNWMIQSSDPTRFVAKAYSFDKNVLKYLVY